MLNLANIEKIIIDTVSEIVDEPIEDTNKNEVTLTDLGINSLDIARLLVKLEQKLGKDPFQSGEALITDVDNLATLISIYDISLKKCIEGKIH